MFEKAAEGILGNEKHKSVVKTVPVEFNFQTNQRKRDKKLSEKEDEESLELGKRPVGKMRKFKEFNIKKDESFKPTCPKAPKFNSFTRKRQREDDATPKFKANPVPDYSKISAQFETKKNVPKIPLTRPVGFNFSTDCRLRKSKMAQEGEDEKKVAEKVTFKAAKAPKFSNAPTIKPSTRKPTKGHCPLLHSQNRSQLRKEKEIKRKEDMEAKEVSIQDVSEFEVTVRSSPEVRLHHGEHSIHAHEINEQESVV